MPNFGRRYTIEPKTVRPSSSYTPQPGRPSGPVSQERPVKTSGDTPSGAVSGIRLFPGNALVISRKYGSARGQLIADLVSQSLTFNVTERGLEPEPFVRLTYRCPKGIFVQTVRGDEEEGSTKQVTALHKTYEFDREAGQALVIRTCVAAGDAALDVETNGLFIQHWFNTERGNVCLRVAATEAWEVFRAEQLSSQTTQYPMPAAVMSESSSEYLAAFMKASEHYLDGEEFDLLRQQAWNIVNRSKNN